MTAAYTSIITALCSGLPEDVKRNDVPQELAIARMEDAAIPYVTRASRRLRVLRKLYGLDMAMGGRSYTRKPPGSLLELFQRFSTLEVDEQRVTFALRGETPRKLKIIECFLAGSSSREIGTELGLAPGTVRGYIRQAMLKAEKRIAGKPRYHNIGRKRTK